MKANGSKSTLISNQNRAESRNGMVRQRTAKWRPHPGDEQLLERCEQLIENGLGGYFQAGQALFTIKTKQLYVKTHDTFEDYCRERWDISRFYAHRLMAAAKVATHLLTNGNIPAPETEAQLRPLVGLESEVANKVWQRAAKEAGGKPITSILVKAAAEEIIH